MDRLQHSVERRYRCDDGRSLTLTRTALFALSKVSAAEILFGRGPARALMCLALSGPTCFRQLGRRFAVESTNLRRSSKRLSRMGVVVFGPQARNGSNRYIVDDPDHPEAWRRPGVRARDQQLALDPRFPLAQELRALLLRFAVVEGWGARARPSLRSSSEIGSAYLPTFDGIDWLFSTPERTKVMLSIAALGHACPGRLADVLGLEPNGVYLMMADLACVGVLASRREQTRRVFWIDPIRPWSNELKSLLKAMLRLKPEYAGVREILGRLDRARDDKEESPLIYGAHSTNVTISSATPTLRSRSDTPMRAPRKGIP